MNLNARFLLWIRKIIKRYGKLILGALALWLLIAMVNNYVGSKSGDKVLSTAYHEDTPIMSDNGSVPKKYVDEIKKTVKEYFDYCIAGINADEEISKANYEKAFNMLSDDCKKNLYNNHVEDFMEYAKEIYTSPTLVYYLQNYSNPNNTYIYEMTISENIEATGTTDGDSYYNEKISLTRDEDNNRFVIANNNYIQTDELNKIFEETNMKIKVVKRDILYNKEIYTVTITNRTNDYIILSDMTANDEILLNIGNRSTKAVNLANNRMYLKPNGTSTFTIIFRKFYDQDDKSEELILNSVRILTEEAFNSSYENSAQVANGNVFSVNIPLE